MEILIEFGTFYFLFWWVMCVLYKEGDYNLSKVLNNAGIWLMTHKMGKAIVFSVFVSLCGILSALCYDFECCFLASLIYITFVGAVLIAFNKVQKLGMCHFCMESHTATLLAIGYSCYWLDPNYLYWGFLCAAINGWLRTFVNR